MKGRLTSLAALALIFLLTWSALSPAVYGRAAAPMSSNQPALRGASLVCTGGISGAVIASDTAGPLEFATVTASLAGTDFVKTAETDADGQYTIAGLPAGQYQVQFEPDPSNRTTYLSEYFNNQSGLTTATLVAVSTGAITPRINAALDVGGTISGIVTGADTSSPLSDVFVNVYTSGGEVVDEAFSDTSGAYTTDALPSGSYKIEFLAPGATKPYLSEFFNNKPDLATAATVTVTAPNDTPSVNAALDLGGQIRGTVTATDGGAGLAGVAVLIYSSDGLAVDSTFTDGTGNYATPGLRAGNYKLRFDPSASDTANAYLEAYYNHKSDRASADLLAVTVPNATTANAALSKGGQFTGLVTAAGTGSALADVNVQVYSSDGQLVGSTSSDSFGSYITPGLAPGSYKLFFDPSQSESATGYAYEYNNNKSTLALADLVAAPAPSAPARIDAALDKGGRIGGKVTLVDADLCGNPLDIQDVVITIYDSSGQPVATTQPDAAGNYTTPELPAGSYRIGFDGPVDAGFDTVYYNDKSGLASADLVSVTPPNTTPNINASLTRAGRLSLPLVHG